MTPVDAPRITPLGASALLARFGDRIDRGLAQHITRLVGALDRLALPGVIDVIPSYTTLLVIFDPDQGDHGALAERVERAWREACHDPDAEDQPVRHHEIPVLYGGDAGPDLTDIARHTGLAPDEVVRRHSDPVYTVGAVGFSPGFAFLIGLPPELETPRRPSPRTRVPAGSVGIAGGQTGVYPRPTPGGWSLIGRTPRVMFDPDGDADLELRPGDGVRFIPVEARDVSTFPEPRAGGEMASGDGALEIVGPGVQSSVQDLGRPGQGRSGITPGGAVDRSALIAGNRLLDNPDGAAAIEWTLLPPAIRFHGPCRVTLTGADPGWRIGDRPVAVGQVVEIGRDATLRAHPVPDMAGARGYVCIEGGIDVPVARGSRSLDLSAGFGGGYGRPLRNGDRLACGARADNPKADIPADEWLVADPAERAFRVVRGPQAERFDATAWRAFLSEPYTVDAQSNRMGLRLNGPSIAPTGGADVVSEAVVTGAIQVTGSGQPIVLLPGRATIGGYAKIATVIEADHDRLGQLRPGDAIRFEEVSLDDAVAALEAWRPSVRGGLGTGEEMTAMTDARDAADAWTPDGVIRVVRELASQDVRAFSLRVEAAGLEIAIERGGGLPGHAWSSTGTDARASEAPGDSPEGSAGVVTAPLLGTFWRRPAPDQPAFVEEGDTIEAGQTVGLIEVMKSFHEVTASRPGTVLRFLVDDGASVEYGQPLVELDPSQGG